jgi:hypothetical protein
MEDFPENLYNFMNSDIIHFYSFPNGHYGHTLWQIFRADEGVYEPAFFEINGNDPEEEQVITLLHEVLHYHPRFAAWTAGYGSPYPRISFKEDVFEEMNEIEHEIEKLAQKTYRTRWDIASLARRTLREAKARDIRTISENLIYEYKWAVKNKSRVRT